MFQPTGDSPVVDYFLAPAPREPNPLVKWSGIAGQPAKSFAKLLSRSVGVTKAAVMLEIERGAPFLFVPVLLAAGAFLYFSLSFEPGVWFILGAAVVAGGATRLTQKGRPSHFASCAVLLIALGIVSAQFETWRHDTKIIGGEISTRIVGRVVSIEQLNNGRARLTVDLISTERPKLRYAPDRIRATARSLTPGIATGSIISGLVKLRPPSGPVRPDSYDFSFESYFDGIGASGYFMQGPEHDQGSAAQADTDWASSFERIRQEIATRVRNRIGGAEGEIAAALMVGVRAGIPEDVSEALRRTGLYHIISISGLHMALVAGVVIAALRASFALFPGIVSLWPIRKIAAIIGFAAIAGYLALSGGEVAAQRSFVMLAVMLTAVVFDRAALTMRNLAISAIIVLMISPHEVMGPSFQMSFAATAALVAAYAIWSGHRVHANSARLVKSQRAGLAFRLVRRLSTLLIGLTATSIVAGLATATFGAFHFQRVAPLSLVANLAVMPIVSIVVMPCAVLAAVAMPFGLDGPILDLMGEAIALMNSVAGWVSDRSPIDAIGLIPSHSVVLLTLALLIATVMSTQLRWASVPFALVGALTLGNAPTPEMLVTEDGKLAGFLARDGTLAVNRSQPNAFTADNWKRVFGASRFRKPVWDQKQIRHSAEHVDEIPQPTSNPFEVAFQCDEITCVGRLSSGGLVVHTTDAEEARIACAFAAVVVLDDATLQLKCANPSTVMITKRDLARYGSAAIYLPVAGSPDPPEVRHALASMNRPWHQHRAFSREARGFPPYRPRPKQADTRKLYDNPKTAPSIDGSGAARSEVATTQALVQQLSATD